MGLIGGMIESLWATHDFVHRCFQDYRTRLTPLSCSRSATHIILPRGPWIEIHGYRHEVAPRQIAADFQKVACS